MESALIADYVGSSPMTASNMWRSFDICAGKTSRLDKKTSGNRRNMLLGSLNLEILEHKRRIGHPQLLIKVDTESGRCVREGHSWSHTSAHIEIPIPARSSCA